MFDVTLYYNFKHILDPELFCQGHREACTRFRLLGRVYIAREGINGTLAGTPESIQSYKKFLHAIPGFEDTEFKTDVASYIPFQRLIVKTRPEIVALHASTPIDPTKERGRHLSPQEWRDSLASGEPVTVLDVRNDYESEIGHFEGAVRPTAENFYDFENWLERSRLDKNKKVLMYCTGGIRCEKFSLLMQKKGFEHVYQLHGGIINYAQTVGDAFYKGKCFVFDDRLAVPVEKNQTDPVGRCAITGVPCDAYLNCANIECNKLFICSEKGAKRWEGCCSQACHRAPRRRPFDPHNIYAPSLRWYKYDHSHPSLMP